MQERTIVLQEYHDEIQRRHVDIAYAMVEITSASSFYTQFSFVNNGTIAAHDVKIRLTFPSGTDIISVIPPFKYTASEDKMNKVVELHILQMGIKVPMALTLLTSERSTGIPEIISHEAKGTKPVSVAD